MSAAVAALVLASCAKNETFRKVSYNEDAVSFSGYSGRTITKAGATDDMNLDALKEHGFGVFATYSGTDAYETLTAATNDFLNNQLVKYYDANGDGVTGWEYTPLKYWPNPTNGKDKDDQKVSFFAYLLATRKTFQQSKKDRRENQRSEESAYLCSR